jgi:hypothetical protein
MVTGECLEYVASFRGFGFGGFAFGFGNCSSNQLDFQRA